jgi:hypothetical protein
MNRPPTPQHTLQRLPKKWAVAILAALITYALVQPFANNRFGWNLPSLAGVLGMQQQEANKPAVSKPVPINTSESGSKVEKRSPSSDSTSPPESQTDADSDSEFESVPTDTKPAVAPSATKSPEKEPPTKSIADSKTSNARAPASAKGSSKPTEPKPTEPKPSEPKPSEPKPSEPKPSEPKPAKPEAASELLHGLLKNAGREVYLSPAGLRYTRGSEEGHRLKHIEKHLKDIPDRPGKHGVFDGDMAQVLRWIDDAYTRGKQGAKGVRKREDDGRTIYEVPFTKPIGFIGGRDGKRDNHPDAKRLRLVVDGDQVITAFPF